MIKFLAAVSLLTLSLVSMAEELPQYAEDVHLGVASCASGVCHGSVKPRSTTRVLQNEYVVWSRLDRHRNAYNLLLNEDSRWIAKNLGLPNAHEAEVCLDCHADNVPAAQRDSKFQISDGVGCEACHGGAERYLMSHTESGRGHAANVEDGLYPLDDINARTALCFSCHIGDDKKIASHEIMGAGHPRLAFEIDTFGILQPAHYVVDDDYRADKWHASSLVTWGHGQVASARQTLRLIDSWLETNQRFPELSLFDCHGCHHPMSDLRWEPGKLDLPPGAVRLNDAGFILLFPLARLAAPELEAGLHDNLRALHEAVLMGNPVQTAVQDLGEILDQLEGAVSRVDGNADVLLADIVTMGAEGQFRDYVAAEQAVMAVDLMLSATGDRDDAVDWLDQLYTAVGDEDSYDPIALESAMKAGR